MLDSSVLGPWVFTNITVLKGSAITSAPGCNPVIIFMETQRQSVSGSIWPVSILQPCSTETDFRLQHPLKPPRLLLLRAFSRMFFSPAVVIPFASNERWENDPLPESNRHCSVSSPVREDRKKKISLQMMIPFSTHYIFFTGKKSSVIETARHLGERQRPVVLF